MSFLARFRPKHDLNKVFALYFSEDKRWEKSGGSTSILAKVVDAIRPRRWKKDTVVDLKEFIDLLENNPTYLEEFKKYVRKILEGKKLDYVLTDAGIIKDVSFFYELKHRIIAKFIPNQPDLNSLEYVLTQVFYVDHDITWITSIKKEQIEKVYNLISFKDESEKKNLFHPKRQMIFATEVLANRIAGAASEAEVNKMVPELADYENPFLALRRELYTFLESYRENPYKTIENDDLDYKQLMILHRHCIDFIDKAYKNTQRFGISIRVNQYLLRINQQLERLKDLIELIVTKEGETKLSKSIDLIYYLISINYQKNNIRSLLDKSTQRVAFEITQHKAKTGEHYITKDKQEYKKMLNASLGGGAIVGVLCVTKLLLYKLDLSPFGMAFVYSLNYAIGFIAIYLLGYTLATKQPAMTASSFVKSLEEGDKNVKKSLRYRTFAILFARLFRSQFIAFVGNVAMAFPVALLGIWVIDLVSFNNIAESKADKLLRDINPTTSLAVLHASIAGLYLFLSGVIAGNISNRIKHNRIPFRIEEHPILKVLLGRKKTKKIADFHGKKYPGIMSNLWFGVFMGSTASIGYFVGLDLDIRHITFASGNLALGLYGADWHITVNMLVWAILGIGIIGFMNFIVSFTLSIIVAMRSCGIAVLELRFIIFSVFRYLLEHPLHFFLPLEKAEEKEEKALSN